MIIEERNSVQVIGWRGLNEDSIAAPADTCRSGKNFSLSDIEEEITLRKGFADLYTTTPTPMDSATWAAMNARTLPTILALERMEIQGGPVYLCVVQYTKATYNGPPPGLTFGLWCRPWYNGSVWVDQWREVNETWVFNIYEIYDDLSGGRFLEIDDPTGLVFNFQNDATGVFPLTGTSGHTYMRGWTIENLDASVATKRFLRCLESRSDSSRNNVVGLRVPFAGPGDLGWAIGHDIKVHRCYPHNGVTLSNPTDPLIHILETGARIMERVQTVAPPNPVYTHIRQFVEFQEHGLGPLTADYAGADGLVSGDMCLDGHRPGFFVGIFQSTGGGTLPASTYYVKYAVKEGDNWSKLYKGPLNATLTYDVTGTNAITTGANELIQLRLHIEPASISKRASDIRIYMSEDDLFYYRVKDVALADLAFGSGEGAHGTTYIDESSTSWNFYGYYEVLTIDGPDWTAAGAEGSADIGRGVDDDGVFLYGAVETTERAGQVVPIFGDVTVDGQDYHSRVFIPSITGAGRYQTDVIQNDRTRDLVADPAPGVTVRAIANLSDDRFLILTNASIAHLSLIGGSASWNIRVLTSDDGIAANRSLVVNDRRAMWAGGNAVWSFSLGEGRRVMNPDWRESYEAIADKSGILGGIHIDKGNYVLVVGGTHYVFPLTASKVPITEAAPQQLGVTPTYIMRTPGDSVFAKENLVFLTASKLYRFGTATRDDGSNITLEYVTNDFRIAPQFYEQLAQQIGVEYYSDVPVTLDLFLDDEATPFDTKTLPADTTIQRVTEGWKLHALAKRFHLRFTATTTADDQTVRIRRVAMIRTLEVVGGVGVRV